MVDRIEFDSTLTSYTVFEAMYDLATKLPVTRYESMVTSATTTTLTDSTMESINGLFTGGTLWVWQKESSILWTHSHVITDHTGTTLTFTPAAALGLTTTDNYMACGGAFPRWLLLQAISMALRDVGSLPFLATCTTVADQQEYDSDDIAMLARGLGVVSIDISTSKTAPYDYVSHHNWSVINTMEKGTTIAFDPGHIPDAGYTMRVTYLASHRDIQGHDIGTGVTPGITDDYEISYQIRPERLAWEAAVHALRVKVSEGPEAPKYSIFLNEALKRAEIARASYPIIKPQTVRMSRWLQAR